MYNSDNMIMTTELRSLLRRPAASKILKTLWEKRDEKEILVFLETTEDCVNEYVTKYHIYQTLPDDMMNVCCNKFDGPFFSELKHCHVIKDFMFSEGELPNDPTETTIELASVNGLNSDMVAKLNEWIKELPYILEYGDISLNTITGIVYFQDQETRLYKNSANFQILQSFLRREQHELSVSEVLRIKEEENTSITAQQARFTDAKVVLKNLGRRMGIKKDLSRIFSYTGRSFVLLS